MLAPVQPTHYPTKKGSMNAASGLAYFKAIAAMYPDISKENGFRVMVICDGHGSHLTLEILTFCRQTGIDLVIRVPHTSQDTQNEDLELFGPLENSFVANKGVRLAQVASASRGRYSLNFSDLGAVLKPAFDKIFTQINVMRGWDTAGLIPFTRKPMLLLLKEQESKVSLLEKFTAEQDGVDVRSFYCNGKNMRGDVDPAAAMDPDMLGRVSTQGKYSVLAPMSDDAAFADVKGRTEAKRTKDQAAVANKEAAEVSKRQKLVDAVPIAAAAMAELASAHGGDWLKLSKDQLLACCLARGLPTAGNKPELSSRLSAAPQLLALLPPLLPPPPPPPPTTTTAEEARLRGQEQELESEESEESEDEGQPWP